VLRSLGLAILSVLLLGACPGRGGAKPTTAGAGGPSRPTGIGAGSGAAGTGAGSPSGGAGDPTLAAGTTCPSPGCVFHPGLVGGAYFACLSSGAGSCFHFGARCAPADACMFDAASLTYRQCTSPVEGECATFAAACTPTSACAFNPTDHLHHTCERWSGGTCAQWGATCAPS